MNILRVFTLISVAVLNDAYRNEKDVNIRERILLVRRVRMDNEEAASVSEKEFHRSRWWAYKWLKRFDNAGLEGLKNKHRSGRPPEVYQKKHLLG
jgi:transposase